MPGYGQSIGSSDYCGIQTQEAIIRAIDFFKDHPYILSDKIVLIGYSRGAIAASMVATKVINLCALVLGAGFYDFEQYFKDAPKGLKDDIRIECNMSKKACSQRSALGNIKKILAPTLVFHGKLDERKGESGAKNLCEQLYAQGTFVKFNLYERYGHDIPFKIFFKETKKF